MNFSLISYFTEEPKIEFLQLLLALRGNNYTDETEK